MGIGVNTPFGLLVNYPTNSPFSTVATSAALPLIDIKPTVAFKLNEYISIGAGIDIYTFTSFAGEGGAEGQRIAGPPFAAIGITPGSTLEFHGKDTALGFNFSAHCLRHFEIQRENLFSPWHLCIAMVPVLI